MGLRFGSVSGKGGAVGVAVAAEDAAEEASDGGKRATLFFGGGGLRVGLECDRRRAGRWRRLRRRHRRRSGLAGEFGRGLRRRLGRGFRRGLIRERSVEGVGDFRLGYLFV